MIQAQQTELRVVSSWVAARRAQGQKFFWVLLALELTLLIGVLAWALDGLLPATRLVQVSENDRWTVVSAVAERLNNQAPDRKLLIAPGVMARESNIRGFSLDGQIYYYQLLGQASYDPLTRGSVAPTQIQIVHDASRASVPFLIYIMKPL